MCYSGGNILYGIRIKIIWTNGSDKMFCRSKMSLFYYLLIIIDISFKDAISESSKYSYYTE